MGHCSIQTTLSKSHLFPFIARSYPPHFSLILPPSCQGCSQAKTNTSYATLVGLCFSAYYWAIFDLVLVHGHLFSVVICHTIFIIFFLFNFKKSSSSLTPSFTEVFLTIVTAGHLGWWNHIPPQVNWNAEDKTLPWHCDTVTSSCLHVWEEPKFHYCSIRSILSSGFTTKESSLSCKQWELSNWNFHFPMLSEKILKIYLYCNSVYLWSMPINSFIFKGTLANTFAKALCNYNICFKQKSVSVFFIQTSMHNSSFIYIYCKQTH